MGSSLSTSQIVGIRFGRRQTPTANSSGCREVVRERVAIFPDKVGLVAKASGIFLTTIIACALYAEMNSQSSQQMIPARF
jgi:hypothetical protein